MYGKCEWSQYFGLETLQEDTSQDSSWIWEGNVKNVSYKTMKQGYRLDSGSSCQAFVNHLTLTVTLNMKAVEILSHLSAMVLIQICGFPTVLHFVAAGFHLGTVWRNCWLCAEGPCTQLSQ